MDGLYEQVSTSSEAPHSILVYLHFGRTNRTNASCATLAKPHYDPPGGGRIKIKKRQLALIGLLLESFASLLLTWSTKTSIILL